MVACLMPSRNTATLCHCGKFSEALMIELWEKASACMPLSLSLPSRCNALCQRRPLSHALVAALYVIVLLRTEEAAKSDNTLRAYLH